MRQKKNYAAIDNFRLAAALLIVGIHTSPLQSFSETADFLVTYCYGRIGVTFDGDRILCVGALSKRNIWE